MLREYRILVPLSPNSCLEDRHKEVRWDSLKGAFLALANGYTEAGIVQGAWKDDDGKLIQEPCREFYLSAPPEAKSRLDAILWCMLPKFDQHCIYVSCGGECWLVGIHDAPEESEEQWARIAMSLGPLWDKKFRKMRDMAESPVPI